MQKTVKLQIPLGYRITERVEYMDIGSAEKVLLTKRRRRYTHAVRTEDQAALYSRDIRCPHCNQIFLANTASPLLSQRDRREDHRIKTRIRQWADGQLSILDQEGDWGLSLYAPLAVQGSFRCPVCQGESSRTDRTRSVELTAQNHKVIVKCCVAGFQELMQPVWLKGKLLQIAFPLYEVLTFDFLRGRIYVRLEDGAGNVEARWDVTEEPASLESGACWKMLTQNKLVIRRTRQLFAGCWGEALPLSARETDVFSLFAMTRFVGYPKSFYAAIPYEQASYRLYESFRATARRMHNARDLCRLYRRSGLPKAKTVRRSLFENPALFFYLDQIRFLWELLQDPNLLCRLLESGNRYAVLSGLHLRPGIRQYLQDYCREKGANIFCDAITRRWERHYSRAQEYCCMNSAMRKQVRKGWSGKQDSSLPEPEMPEISVPMCRIDPRIQDCRVDGYDFFWLVSSNDYLAAGQKLQNCLNHWRNTDDPVVGVKRCGGYVAAIQLRKGVIVQARGYDNCSVEEDPKLYEAIDKWRVRQGLCWGDLEDTLLYNDGGNPFGDDLPMPF